ncbi:MAG: TatD family hydrolase [Ignavibacteria bacterium]
MIIDTHAHLYYPEIIKNLDEILSRAKDAGVEKIIAPAVDLESSKILIDLSEKHEMIYCAIGIHPCDVNKFELDIFDEIDKLLSHEKIVAVGETGLDYYWDISNIEKQKTFFRLQIDLAKSYKLPVVIHTRNSTQDAIDIINSKYDEDLRGQFHCFSGTESELDQVLNLNNFYISFCGNITYKNFTGNNLILKAPVEKLLSETDSPFLPPVPYRGKKNEPSYIIETLKKISEIKEFDHNSFMKIIYNNAYKIFFN